MHPLRHGAALVALTLAWSALPVAAQTPSLNPDISLVGQPVMRWSNDPADPARKRPRLEVGETELLVTAPLNPYARGTATFTFGEEGADVEEAYFTLNRGLPAGLVLKGGKYRSGFGRLNGAHPHTYPFAERFRVLAAYLPGEEALNEPAVQLSELVALPGDGSLTLSADWLQGDTFRIERVSSGVANDPLELPGAGDRAEEPRAAGLGRLAAFVPVGDRSGVELGFSALTGTNNVAAAARTTVLGGDLKAKLWNSARSYVVVQGEYLALDRDRAAWDATGARYVTTRERPSGGYVFADYNFATRYNAGLSFERFQPAGGGGAWNQATGLFAGLALMEETTVFRIAWDRLQPGAPSGAPEPDAVNSLTLRVVYSMGPHKAHQF